MCELELIERERKAAERRLKAARFPAAKALDEFDFAARASVTKPLVLDLARGVYLARRENVLLVGPSGTGKTHLAIALGMAACAQGQRVRFWRVRALLTRLNWLPALALDILAFVCLHVGPYDAGVSLKDLAIWTGVGLATGACYVRTESLTACIFLHSAINGSLVAWQLRLGRI